MNRKLWWAGLLSGGLFLESALADTYRTPLAGTEYHSRRVQTPEKGAVPLPPFPADDPKAWVCQESPPPATVEAIRAWCGAHPDRGRPARLGMAPATVSDLRAKNRYDEALRGFLRKRAYRKLGWISDRSWRLTGPYVGPFGDGMSYGVHPAVRVWYSPEIADWLCAGRPEGGLPDGAMIIKEMASIDPSVLGIEQAASCMVIEETPDAIEPSSWTVMVRPCRQPDGAPCASIKFNDQLSTHLPHKIAIALTERSASNNGVRLHKDCVVLDMLWAAGGIHHSCIFCINGSRLFLENGDNFGNLPGYKRVGNQRIHFSYHSFENKPRHGSYKPLHS